MTAMKPSWLRRFCNQLTGGAVTRSAQHRPTPRKLFAEQLEDRCVPTVSFGSVFGVANDPTVYTSVVRDLAVDPAGNTYVSGCMRGTVDFDPGISHLGDTDILTARGSSDIFVAKYAPDNSLVWAQRMGSDDMGSAGEGGFKIALDGNGNVYLAGTFTMTADFGPITLTSVGGVDAFVAKLNSNGVVQWANRSGTAGFDIGHGIGLDAAGNVYALVGHENVSYDVFKFSPSGTTLWVDTIATGYLSALSGGLTVDTTGNVFVGGSFSGTVDFDPAPGAKHTQNVSSGPHYAGFVLKLNTAGAFGWVSPFVTLSPDGFSAVQSLIRDGSGNVIVGGAYGGSVDFNPGNGTTTLSITGRGFITKLNSGGGLVWARALESDNSVMVERLAVDAAGSVYATGYFSGTVDLNPGAGTQSVTTAGGTDAFIVKLDAAGNFAWASAFGSTGNDQGFGIAVDAAGTVYMAGSYNGTIDFDPDPLGTSYLYDGGLYLLRLQQS